MPHAPAQAHPPPVQDWVIRPATPADRDRIYAARHEIYARELGQHAVNDQGRLSDPLDAFNTYLVATLHEEIVGFVSITPPGHGRYSIDKYVSRQDLPFPVDEGLYEIRLLTVLPRGRRSFLALALMWAAFRWTESRGGTRIVAIGREDVLSMYERVGLKTVGPRFQAGAVVYLLMQGTLQDVHDHLGSIDGMLHRIEAEVQWDLGVAYWTPAPCYHGGEFFRAIGEAFDTLERHQDVINADVLDAWFPPAPGVLDSLRQDLAWLVRTSPPVDCCGFARAVARARGIPAASILPGAGSSDLIFRALRHWARPESRVLLLEPTYGEYDHVLSSVVGCQVERWQLPRERGYRWETAELSQRTREGRFDLVVLVNPNSPTGQHVPRAELEPVLSQLPATTRLWIDETYIDYPGSRESLEDVAARADNVVICKSMSKAYALSGLRVAYLCAAPQALEALRAITPPWVIGLPAQLAAVRALQDPDYYTRRWAETRRLRDALAQDLRSLDFEVLPGSANFVLCRAPSTGPDAATVAARCRERGLWMRLIPLAGCSEQDVAIRIAVKGAETSRRMADILRQALERRTPDPAHGRSSATAPAVAQP